MNFVSFTWFAFHFFIFCMIGWVWESTYESILNKKLLNRGFLNGPYIPIYGFGGSFILVFLQRFQAPFLSKTTLIVYICGALGATALEYVTSYVLEKILHARWWDYSDYPLNINGRICLIATVFWGVVAVGAIDFLNPALGRLYNYAGHDAQLVFVSVMITLFCVDLSLTINSILDLKHRMQLMISLEADKVMELVEKNKIDIGKYREKILSIGNPFTNRILTSFPKLRFTSERVQNVYIKFKSMRENRREGK